MENTKKVRKKRFNFLKFLVFILFLYIVVAFVVNILEVPIKNIVILNNNYLTDETIIETAKLENYPSFIKTMKSSIKKRLKKLDLIEEVKVRKKFGYILEIEVIENKILFLSRSDNMYTLKSGATVELDKINGIPVLINFVPEDIKEKFILKMGNLSINAISKISEIEYSQTSYDLERFIFYMNDGNMIYINISKINKLNKYNQIVSELEGHTGILYLDSGNYFEIKD